MPKGQRLPGTNGLVTDQHDPYEDPLVTAARRTREAKVDEAKSNCWGRWARIYAGRVRHWFPSLNKGVALCGATPPVAGPIHRLRPCKICDTLLISAQYIAGVRMPKNRHATPHAPWNDEEDST